jgi:hypothetical protein
MERETGIEPATNSLEGCDSTTELLPQNSFSLPAVSLQLVLGLPQPKLPHPPLHKPEAGERAANAEIWS